MPDQHKPGPATNALVAEKVGWTAYREQRGDYELAVAVRPNGRPPWEKYQYKYRERERKRYTKITCSEAVALGFFGQEFPKFTTDIAAAWEVVQRMRDLGYQMEMRTYMTKIEEDGCQVQAAVRFLENPPNDWMAKRCWEPEGMSLGDRVEYAPMAICLAALAVVESEADDA